MVGPCYVTKFAPTELLKNTTYVIGDPVNSQDFVPFDMQPACGYTTRYSMT